MLVWVVLYLEERCVSPWPLLDRHNLEFRWAWLNLFFRFSSCCYYCLLLGDPFAKCRNAMGTIASHRIVNQYRSKTFSLR